MADDILTRNKWDEHFKKDTEELCRKLVPNIDMRDFRANVLPIIDQHIDNGNIVHIATFITFADGGNKYYCSDREPKSPLAI